ncbi:MAG TPA: DUF1178 family protein [Caulobacteraceae bacterium]
MIRYALACEHGHEFEGWFGASADYDDQSARGLLECPVCASHAVSKQIMAPAVSGTKARGVNVDDTKSRDAKSRAVMMEAMGQIRRHVEDNFDYVGDTFAKEARAIHEGKSEERGIYGEASAAEVKALVEDGVPVAPLPPEPPKKTQMN